MPVLSLKKPTCSLSFIQALISLLGHPPSIPPFTFGRLELLGRLQASTCKNLTLRLLAFFISFRSRRRSDCQSRFIHALIESRRVSPSHMARLPKRDMRVKRYTSIRRVNAINESARITCSATSLASLPPSRLPGPHSISSETPGSAFPRPAVRISSAREAERGHKFAARADR